MRKSKFGTSAAAILFGVVSVTTLFSFTACGKKDGNQTSSNGSKTTSEYVYQSTFQDLGNVKADYLETAQVIEDTVYMYGSHYEYDEKTEESTSENYLITCNVDGTNLQETNLKNLKLKKDEYINSLLADPDGTLRMLTNMYKWNAKKETGTNRFYIYDMSKDGELSNKIELKSKTSEEDYFYPSSRNMAYIGDTLYIAADQKIYVFKPDGTLKETLEVESYVETLFSTADEKLYAVGYFSDNYGIYEIDSKDGSTKEPLGDVNGMNVYNLRNVHITDDNILYFNTGNNIGKIDMESKKSSILFDWLNVDLDQNTVVDFIPQENDSFHVITSVSEDNKGADLEFVDVAKVKASEVPQKTILTLATASYMDDPIRKKILDYNKKSEKFRIQLQDYTNDDDPQSKLNLDITSGNIPDILSINSLPIDIYVKKGILADLYPLMEKDEEISKEDFVESVVNTVEKDGKLYYMPSSFSISALIGSKENFGDTTGWTVEDMIKAYENMPKDGVFMRYMTREWFVQSIINAQLPNYIDWDKGTANFDTEDFIKLIEFSKNFQAEEDYNYDDNQESMPTLVKKGKLLLESLYIYDFNEIQMYTKLFKKHGGFTILSYPSPDKNDRLVMNTNGTTFCITEQCADKEGAWEFVREMLTYDYQKNGMWGDMPTRKDALDMKIEHAMATEKYTDKDGDEVYPYQSGYGYDDYQVELGPASQEDVDLIKGLIDRIGVTSSYNTTMDEIINIINEELGGFYAGDKSAEDTAKVIQSRVNIYISTNS